MGVNATRELLTDWAGERKKRKSGGGLFLGRRWREYRGGGQDAERGRKWKRVRDGHSVEGRTWAREQMELEATVALLHRDGKIEVD